MKTKAIFLLPILGSLSAFAAGCSDDEETTGPGTTTATTSTTTTTTEVEQGSIRVLHLSPDAPGVDVLVNGELRAVEGLEFPEGTEYLSVEAGSYDFAVVPAGGAAADSVLDISGLAIEAGESYTAVAYGELAEIAALPLVDDLSEPAAGNIRVRAIHTAAGVGEVDIWNVPSSGSPSELYSNVGFGVVGEYLELPVGAYTLGFDVDNDASPDLLFEVPELPEGTVANIFAVQDTMDEVFLLAQLGDSTTVRIDATPTEPTASVRVLHLSPDAPAVDVFANETGPVVSGLEFPEGTNYLSVPAGSYDFQISAEGQPASSAVLEIEGLALEENRSYTAVAYDELASLTALALEDDLSAPAAGNIRVRAIHTAAGVGEVDIWNVTDGENPGLLYENVGFGVAGAAAELPAGAYQLGFDVDDDATPDLTFTLPSLAEGTIANLFAVNDGDVFLLAQFSDGTTARIDADAPRAMLRVLHISPDAPEVDVWVNGQSAAVQSLAFAEGTGFLSLEAATYDFQVAPAGQGAGSSVLDIAGLTLEPGASYTAVAFDQLTSIKALALRDDFEALAAGNIRVRAIHAASGVGTVDIWEVSDPGSPLALYPDFDFGAVGAYLDLPAAAYKLGFDVNADATPDVTFALPSLPAGTVANVFAINDGAVHLLAQLADGSLARVDATP